MTIVRSGLRQLYVLPLLGACLLLAISGVLFYSISAGSSAATGVQWREAGLQGVLVHSLALGHRHSGLAFAGAHGGVYRLRRDHVWRRVLAGGDIWSVELLPDDSTVLAADNNGDIDLSRDAGSHWRQVQVTSQGAYAVSAVPGQGGRGYPRRILLGAGGGVYLSRDGGAHWERRLALPGSAGAAFAWQPGSTRTVYAGAVSGSPSGSTQVFISRDAGETWRVFGRDLNSTGGIMSLAVTPHVGQLSSPQMSGRGGDVFTGTMGNAAWKASSTRGIWRKIANGMPPTGDHVAAIATVPGSPQTLFAATLGYGVFQTTDGGKHWTSISGNLPASRNATIVLSLAYDPVSHILYAGTADGIYEAIKSFPG